MAFIVSPLVTELSTLITEIQAVIPLTTDPGQLLPLAQRVLQKSEQLSTEAQTTDQESNILETVGIDLWTCASSQLHIGSTQCLKTEEIRTTLHNIAYNVLLKAYTQSSDNDIDVVFTLFDLAVTIGSGWANCQKFDRSSTILQSAEQWQQKFNWLSSRKEQQPRQFSSKLKERQTDLLVARAELAARQSEWKEVQVYVKRIQRTLALGNSTDQQNVNLLFHFCFDVAGSLIKSKEWDQALHWILSFCSNIKSVDHCNGRVLVGLVQLIGDMLWKRKREALDEARVHQLLETIDCLAKGQMNNSWDYHFAKIMSLLASPILRGQPLENAVFAMVETIDVTIASRFECARNFHRLVGALDLFVQRCQPDHTADSSDQDQLFSQIYLHKIYIIAEWITTQIDSVDQSPHYHDTIKRLMEEIYLLKDKLSSEALLGCQLVLWSVGDAFFNNGLYSSALTWYLQIWSFQLTVLDEQDNMQVLARKITICHTEQGTFVNVSKYIETALAKTQNAANAIDYLLLFKIQLHLKEMDQASHYLDLLLDIPDLTIDMIVSGADICYTTECIELMQVILNHSFAIASNYVNDESFERNLMIMLRWTIRLCVSGKCDATTKSVNLLANKKCILNSMEKGVTFFESCTGVLSPLLKEDQDWVLRTGWNLALQFYNIGETTQGSKLFMVTYKAIRLSARQGSMDKNYIPCLFVCMASQLISSDFNQLSLEAKADVCTEFLLVVKEVSGPTAEYLRHEVIVTVRAWVEIQCYTTLERFEEAFNILMSYDHQLNESTSIGALRMYERLAGMVLHHTGRPFRVAVSVLKLVATRFQQYTENDQLVERWAQWNRFFVFTAMMDNETKEDVFNYIHELCSLLASDCLSYPQKEIHYLVVVTWNEGVTRLNVSSSLGLSRRWCDLSFDLLGFLDDSHHAIKHQIGRAYQCLERTFSSET